MTTGTEPTATLRTARSTVGIAILLIVTLALVAGCDARGEAPLPDEDAGAGPPAAAPATVEGPEYPATDPEEEPGAEADDDPIGPPPMSEPTQGPGPADPGR